MLELGDLVEALAAFVAALGVFLILGAIGGLIIGLGTGLLVIGGYLAYVAQFLTGSLREERITVSSESRVVR